jgi:hypothetical protein
MTVLSRVAHVLLALALLGAPVVPLAAQVGPPEVPGGTVGPVDDSSKDGPNLAERLLVGPREPRCEDNGQVGGINVCGKKKDNSKDRLPITGDLAAATATGDGLPRAPDVMGNRITGHSIKFGCIVCPKTMLPDIDFRLLPDDPVGSDADRIGKGEIRGN